MDKNDSLVIFTHGIAEGPQVFQDLISLCQAMGCATEAITLPGHCCSCREFAKTDGSHWLEHLIATIDKYAPKYQNIVLVGHSLGSILSILTADATDKIKGIILLNAPLAVKVRSRAIITNLQIGLGMDIKPSDKAWAASQAISVGQGRLWEYIGWIPRIADLFRFIKQAKRKLPGLMVPILAIHSDKDELVGPRTVRLFKRLTDENTCRLLQLPNSTHFTGPIEDKLAATDAITQMIRLCTTKSEGTGRNR